ncbi:MAG: hypothetical protein FJW30_00830 [Acidobacteria bacterium]|nr:hypothetical protein [Acidobacteriota bacterium]
MRASFWFLSVAAFAGLGGSFLVSLDHEAIEYTKRPTNDPITRLNRKLADGREKLSFRDDGTGYLAAVLKVLDVPVESQVMVFSKTSFQAPRITPRMPRALYFNDDVTVGFVQTGDVVEVTSLDPQQGVIFYSLDQEDLAKPRFERRDTCLQCHQSTATLGVPGLVVRSVVSEPSGYPMFQAGTKITDHRSPLEDRWGGWYVTGKQTGKHMGNMVAVERDKPESLQQIQGRFDPARYLTPNSDVVALMVLEHQTQMTNLLVRVNFEVRHALHHQRTMNGIFGDPPATRSDSTRRRIREAAEELVDYLLFVEEAPLPGPVIGSSGFAEKFSGRGPFDPQGRGLRQLDLTKRLFRFPCSYMIYSEAFDGMPPEALDAVYRRLHTVLTGNAMGKKYAGLTVADRRNILGILKATKQGMPAYLKNATL